MSDKDQKDYQDYLDYQKYTSSQTPSTSLWDKLTGPIPKKFRDVAPEVVDQTTTPGGVNEIFARELAGKAGSALVGAAKSAGAEALSSPLAQALLHKTGLSSIAKLGPKFLEGLKGPVGAGLDVAAPTVEAAAAPEAATLSKALSPEAVSNKIKNAKWDFPVKRGGPIDPTGGAF